jgi:hypothetical protein
MYTQQEVIQRLIQSITPFYTVNYSEDTNLYAVLSMYATEYVSGSAKLEEIYNDLYVLLATTQKLYDNFGVYVDQPKYFYQNVKEDTYILGSGSIPSYVKNIDFLLDAAVHGSTLYAIDRVSNAYTLINPQINEYYTIPRWKLKHSTGSISATSNNILTIVQSGSIDPGWKEHEWVGAIATLTSGSVFGYYSTLDNTQNTIYLGGISSTIVD